MKHLRAALPLTLTFVLAACGGGTTPTPPTEQPPVETPVDPITPPTTGPITPVPVPPGRPRLTQNRRHRLAMFPTTANGKLPLQRIVV